jgi:hypothetical protein
MPFEHADRLAAPGDRQGRGKTGDAGTDDRYVDGLHHVVR